MIIGIGMIVGGLCGCKSKNEIAYSSKAVDNVEALWQIIDEKYCYVDEKPCNWNTVGAEYIQRAQQLDAQKLQDHKHQIALFDLLESMLDSLWDGHVNLYTSFDVSNCRLWYEGYPTNFSSQLQAKYLGDYRVAGGMRYNVIVRGTDSIGYVYLGSFESGVADSNMWWILQQMSNCKGLIVDVRHNGGGNMDLAEKLAGYFYREDRVAGYWQHKTGKGHQDMSDPAEMIIKKNEKIQWQRPVMVLIDRHSYSATNFFASVMRYADNCLLIGGKSGGGGGMPLSYEIPIGWKVRFSSVRMMDREHKSIEEGVMPDREVTLVSTDKDDIIEAAIEEIGRR